MATPFAVHAGALQQRMATAFDDETGFAYELGHAGHLDVRLAIGDRHDLFQSFTIAAGAALIRMRVRIVAPPIAVSWEFSAHLNGVQHYARSFNTARQVLVLNDVAVRLHTANASPTPNTLMLRLRRM